MLHRLIRVGWDDAVELRLGCAEMIANDFSEHGAVINGTLEIPVAGAEHRSTGAGRTGRGPSRTRRCPVWRAHRSVLARVARVNAAVHASACNVHHAGLGVIGPGGLVFNRGPAELRKSHDHYIVPQVPALVVV